MIFSQGWSIPVELVENSGRCNKNESDEKVGQIFHAMLLVNSSSESFIIFIIFNPLTRSISAGLLTIGSSEWHCLDPEFSGNNHTSGAEWKQVHCR